VSGYGAGASKTRIYRLDDGGDVSLSCGKNLLLNLGGRLGRSRLLGLDGYRRERVSGREGV
jgi:hypothetical protein